MTAHSVLGASSSHRWMNCPGSVRLIESLPPGNDQGSEYAAEGSVAHGIGEHILSGKKAPKPGTVIPHDQFHICVTEEMLAAVDVYVKYVRKHKRGAQMQLELRLSLEQVSPDMFGTADCVLWHPARKLLEVIDYKHGAGVAVEVEDNSQLMYYALGALLTCGYKPDDVCVTIVQPRCPHADGPIRSVTFKAVDLLDFMADLKDAAEATKKPDAPLAVGDWCRWCAAASVCPAQKQNIQALARLTFDDIPAVRPPAPDALTLPELSDVLDKLPIFEAWAKSVREHAYQLAENGTPPPNYKLVEKVARRQVREDFSPGMLAHVAEVDIDDLYDKRLKGIADLEKLMPGKNAKERAAALDPFVVKESTGHVLVHDSDKRPAVNPQAAAKLIFQPE